MKADYNTITSFGVKVMSKNKALSKCERGVIKKMYTLLYLKRFIYFKICSNNGSAKSSSDSGTSKSNKLGSKLFMQQSIMLTDKMLC